MGFSSDSMWTSFGLLDPRDDHNRWNQTLQDERIRYRNVKAEVKSDLSKVIKRRFVISRFDYHNRIQNLSTHYQECLGVLRMTLGIRF